MDRFGFDADIDDNIDETGADAFRDDFQGASFEAKALPFPTLDLADLATTTAEPKRFVIERLAPAGEVTLFTGHGGAGKSLLGQQFATAAAAGLSCLGLEVEPAPAIYLTCEDDSRELHWRQTQLCAALGIGMESLVGKLHLVSLRGELDNAFCTFTAEGMLRPTVAYDRFAALLDGSGSRHAYLDNVAHLFTGDENSRVHTTQFVNLLNRLAGETGSAISLIAHPNKSGGRYSGSTAWLNAVRSHIFLSIPTDGEGEIADPDARMLSLGKANYARMGEALAFRWHDGAFVREADLTSDTARELAEAIKVSGENEAFLRCLRTRNGQGGGREVGPSPGPNYAPSQFEGMAEAKGLGKAALKRAMDRLFNIGRIASETVDRPGKSGTKTIIVEVPER